MTTMTMTTMKAKPKTATCGARMHTGRSAALRKLKVKCPRICCDKEPNHFGNHHARTRIGEFTWWNLRG